MLSCLKTNLASIELNSVNVSLLFSISSIAMILLNKACMSMFQNVSCLLLMQNMTTILILKMKNGTHLNFKIEIAKKWVLCAFLFCLNIASSLQSLAFISVPTFTVLRNSQPVLAWSLQRLMRQKDTKWDSLLYLFGVFTGAIIYCMHDMEFNMQGYIYAAIHVFSMTFYSITVKNKLDDLKISAEEMSYYNNILSLPLLFLHTIFKFHSHKEYSFVDDVLSCSGKWECLIIVLLSCIGGFCVSVTGFQAQNVMSPTSWLCLNNISKIPAILISLTIFGGYYSLATFHGMFISITCALLYSISNLQRTGTFLQTFAFFVIASSLGWSRHYQYMISTAIRNYGASR